METLKHAVLKCAIVLCIITSTADGWPWSEDKHRIDEEVQRRVEAEQKLTVQERKTDGWCIVAFILGIGCLGFLIIGAALGSRGRQHAENDH